MKHLDEGYVFEKLEEARLFTKEAAWDEKNGHTKTARALLKAAREQVMSAARELSRGINAEITQ